MIEFFRSFLLAWMKKRSSVGYWCGRVHWIASLYRLEFKRRRDKSKEFYRQTNEGEKRMVDKNPSFFRGSKLKRSNDRGSEALHLMIGNRGGSNEGKRFLFLPNRSSLIPASFASDVV